MAYLGASSAGTAERTDGASPERLLRDMLRRSRGSGDSALALVIHVSGTVEASQRRQVGKVVKGSIATIIDRYDLAVFQLDCDDVVIIYRPDCARMLTAIAEKIDEMVRRTCPKAAARARAGHELCRWYDLAVEDDRQALDDLATAALAGVERRSRIAAASDTMLRKARPLDSTGLDELSSRLHERQITDFLRQQVAVELTPNGNAVPLFYETFVSMAALEASLAPEMEVGGQTTLFRYLTEILDRHVLTALPHAGLGCTKRWTSINLNLTTLASDDFVQFQKAIAVSKQLMVIEIQFADLLANTPIYEVVRGKLQESGYRVLVDGLSPVAVEFIDLAALNADYLKLVWSRDVSAGVSAESLPDIRQRITRFGREKVLMSRVDTEDAVRWALSVGISRFQGFFIDLLMERLAARPPADTGGQ